MTNKILMTIAVSVLALNGAFADSTMKVDGEVEAGGTTGTVHTKTYVQTQDIENVNKVNFKVFDTNNDGQYAMEEVGERLFKSFDRDGNEVIDNLEWDRPAVMTITPMESETFTFVDSDGDGVTDSSTYTYDTFYKASGLIKFDANQNGLSAHEFIDEDFKTIDVNDDKTLTLDEWKEVYLNSRMSHEEAAAYNE